MKKLLAILLLAILPCQASRVFNGSGDTISTPGVGTPVDISTGPMTISVWIYPTVADLTGVAAVADKWDGNVDASSQYWIGIGGLGSDAQVGFVVGTYGVLLGVYAQCGLTLVANNWYQVLLMVDPAGTFFGTPTVGMWVTSPTAGNCTSQTTFRERRTAGGVPLLLGKESTSGSPRYFAGRMAEFAMWNSVVSAAEVTALNKVCPEKIHRTTMVSYKPLWGASGASIEPDLAGLTSINGALTGTTIATHAPCAP